MKTEIIDKKTTVALRDLPKGAYFTTARYPESVFLVVTMGRTQERKYVEISGDEAGTCWRTINENTPSMQVTQVYPIEPVQFTRNR